MAATINRRALAANQDCPIITLFHNAVFVAALSDFGGHDVAFTAYGGGVVGA